MDESERIAITTWLHTNFNAEAWASLRALIAQHDAHVQDLPLAARTDAIVDALLIEAESNPALAEALQHAVHDGVERRKRQASCN